MKWIARVLVFGTALSFGTFAASFFWDEETPDVFSSSFERSTPLSAKSFLGTWKGSWGHNDGDCTIEIYKVDGNAFYGTLRKEGAEVRFEGTFEPETRMFYFDETKVVRLGAHMREWSLGKNSGIISEDGRILVGDGRDKWGQYGWAASNY